MRETHGQFFVPQSVNTSSAPTPPTASNSVRYYLAISALDARGSDCYEIHSTVFVKTDMVAPMETLGGAVSILLLNFNSRVLSISFANMLCRVHTVTEL